MIKIFLFFVLLNFLAACQSTKDAFTLKKKNSGDEFLIEKKSPLVLPPEYGELPTPDSQVIKNDSKNKNDVLMSLNKDGTIIDNTTKDSKPTSIEESVLKKIK